MANKSIYKLEDYADFSKATAAEKKKAEAESAVANYSPFQYDSQEQYDQAKNTLANMKPFTYDLNSDALYEQYKNQYQALGKLAMQDTMGQAAALTGGYGNSYAATAGNQAYQSYLTQLSDVVPQLYQLALSKYNADRDAANDAFSALSSDRSTKYGEWSDQYNRLLSERDYAGTEYSNAYNLAVQLARNAIADEQDLRDYNYKVERDKVFDQQWQTNFDYQKSVDDRNYNYTVERDKVADQQWQKQYNLSASSTALEREKYNDEKNSKKVNGYSLASAAASSIANNEERLNYLGQMVDNGLIDEDQMETLMKDNFRTITDGGGQSGVTYEWWSKIKEDQE